MADLFRDIVQGLGKAGEIWTYGPHAVAEEKRRQQEFEQAQKSLPMKEEREKALYESRLAAEKSRQASWESKGQNKRIDLPVLSKTLEVLNVQRAGATGAQLEALDKLIGIVNNQMMSQLSGGVGTPSVTESLIPKQQNWQAVTETAPQIANSWTQPDAFTGYIAPPEPQPSRTPSGPGFFGRLNSAIKSGGYTSGFRGFGAPPSGGALSGLQTTPMTRPPVAPTPTTTQNAGVVRPQTQQEFDALPAGTKFMKPDGTVWVK